jgi:hypothetical protein
MHLGGSELVGTISKIFYLCVASAALSIASNSATGDAASNTAALTETNVYQQLLSQYGRTVVTVSYVLSYDGAGSDQRAQGETEATLVSADGLLILPSAVLNPTDMFMKVYQSQGDGQVPNMRSSAMKVRLPGSDQPLDAEVVSQDRDLGLAWLKIKKPPKNLAYVDLANALNPVIGQEAFVVGVISEEFDYAPYIEPTRIQGKIEVPYKAYITDQPGKMLFSASGVPLGFAVLRIDGTANMSAGGNYRMFATMIGGERLKELHLRVQAMANSNGAKPKK